MRTPDQTLAYPISSDYVRNWTTARAMSELVANAIDAGYEWEMEYVPSASLYGGHIVLTDKGLGIPEEGLILGYSPKADDGSAIGQFGEGKKIAMLVFARSEEVGEVHCSTVGYSFSPRISDSAITGGLARRESTGSLGLLTYDLWASDRTSGTEYRIETSREVYEQTKERFLCFADKSYKQPSEPGRIITTGKPGRIYIGGVLVTESEDLIFSYDLALSSAKQFQNRDRTVIDQWQLRNALRNIINTCTDKKIIGRYIDAALDNKLSESEQIFQPETYESRHAWADAASKKFGANPATAKLFWTPNGEEELTLSAVDQGYVEVNCDLGYTKKDFFALLGIRSASEVANRVSTDEDKNRTVWVADKKLRDYERENLVRAMEACRSLYGSDTTPKVRVYTKYIVDGENSPALGFYEPNTRKIAIRRDILTNAFTTLRIVLHESAHYFACMDRSMTGSYIEEYADRTRGFESQLDWMLAEAVTRLIRADVISTEPEPEPEMTPAVGFAEIFEPLFKQMGHTTGKSFAEYHGVKASHVNALRKGRTLNSVHDANYVSNLVGITPGVAWLATTFHQLETIEGAVARRNKPTSEWTQDKRNLYGETVERLQRDPWCWEGGDMLKRILEGNLHSGDTVRNAIWKLVRCEANRHCIALSEKAMAAAQGL